MGSLLGAGGAVSCHFGDEVCGFGLVVMGMGMVGMKWDRDGQQEKGSVC